MFLSDFDYPLPKDLIAQRPLSQRDASRLLIVNRQKNSLEDRKFSDIIDYVPAGDVLVLNNTKVFAARLQARKSVTGGKVEILLLSPIDKARWKCLVRPSVKEGQEMDLVEHDAQAILLKRTQGVCDVEFKGIADVMSFAKRSGQVPLPPYIKRDADTTDEEAYQTVYAKAEGAVAAPTAGLHFTDQLIERINKKGIEILFVTLHVGYGTFRPVENLEEHKMHAEDFILSVETADRINLARSKKRGVWAVGTTTLRVLETCVQRKQVIPGTGQTDLFIQSPFRFEAVDHLITNFHLPKTTLLLLVSAFMGEDFRKKAYNHAIREQYRFYSYGDAMLIV